MTPAEIDTNTPEGFKEARQALDLSVRDLAFVLGMSEAGEKTIRKWERDGGLGPNPVAAQAMRWFLEGFRPQGWPTDDAGA